MVSSKTLGHDDTSGFEFVKRTLGNNVTAAVNFDRLQKNPAGGYIIFEFLKCEEGQTVTPYTSHPNRYWNKNASKFLSLWRARQDFSATLYLVNYAEENTKHADEILLIEVKDMDENGITDEIVTRYHFESFSKWFVEMNNKCLEPKEALVQEIYSNKTIDELGKIKLKQGKHANESISNIYVNDIGYLEWHSTTNYEYSKAVSCFLKKVKELEKNK